MALEKACVLKFGKRYHALAFSMHGLWKRPLHWLWKRHLAWLIPKGDEPNTANGVVKNGAWVAGWGCL